MEQRIQFNFLPLKNSDFTFEIYRRPVDGEKDEAEFQYRIPHSSGCKDNYGLFFISFMPRNGSESFICSSFDNIYLTQKWLASKVLAKANDVFNDDDFFLGKNKIPCTSFIIKQTEYGSQVIDIEVYFLKKTQEFGFLVDFRFAANERGKYAVEGKKYSLSLAEDGSKNKNFYLDKYQHVLHFINQYIPRIFPLQINALAVDVIRELRPLPCSLLKEKQYVFGGEHKNTNQFGGLTAHHPSAQPQKEPHYVFIFHKSRINISREIVKALRGETYITFPGMEKMFKVSFSNDKISSIQVDNYNKESLSAIENQLDDIIQKHPKSQTVGIFAGIQKDFDDNQLYSPYYIVKNMFLKKGLAVQAITIEQAQKRDGLKWSISGIGLQLFVKLGGVPWKVVPQNEHCIILGISSAHIRDDNGKIKKYYAYSVCLDSSGIYRRLDILSTSESEGTYMETLKARISQALKENITNGISKCAIHVPFRIRDYEMRCLRECVNKYRQNNADIEIVFIKINVKNRFFGYSNYNSKVPLAGSYIELSNHEFLVWFEGLQQGKENLVTPQAVTNPVHIEFLGVENLTADQIRKYLQDVINLSGANWRGYNAKHTPVSIYYPSLIAKFIGCFDKYNLEMELGLDAIDKVWFV